MRIAISGREPPSQGRNGNRPPEPWCTHGLYAGGTISGNHWEPPPEAASLGGVVTVGNHPGSACDGTGSEGLRW